MSVFLHLPEDFPVELMASILDNKDWLSFNNSQKEHVSPSTFYLDKFQNTNLNFSPKNFLLKTLVQDEKLEILETDYPQQSFYQLVDFKAQKKVHLHVILGEDKSNWDYFLSALSLLQQIPLQEIILHIAGNQNLITHLDYLISENHDFFNSLKDKIKLGSLTDLSYFESSKDQLENLLLSLRIIFKPMVASQNLEYTSLDEYLKVNYNLRYYENFDYYTQVDLENFAKEENWLICVKKILNFKTNSKTIFPTDVVNHSLGLGEIIWFLNSPEQSSDFYTLFMELAQAFQLDVQALINFNPKLKESSKIVENFFLPVLTSYPEIKQKIIVNVFDPSDSTKYYLGSLKDLQIVSLDYDKVTDPVDEAKITKLVSSLNPVFLDLSSLSHKEVETFVEVIQSLKLLAEVGLYNLSHKGLDLCIQQTKFQVLIAKDTNWSLSDIQYESEAFWKDRIASNPKVLPFQSLPYFLPGLMVV